MYTYCVMLDVPRDLVLYVSRLLHQECVRRGTRLLSAPAYQQPAEWPKTYAQWTISSSPVIPISAKWSHRALPAVAEAVGAGVVLESATAATADSSRALAAIRARQWRPRVPVGFSVMECSQVDVG